MAAKKKTGYCTNDLGLSPFVTHHWVKAQDVPLSRIAIVTCQDCGAQSHALMTTEGAVDKEWFALLRAAHDAKIHRIQGTYALQVDDIKRADYKKLLSVEEEAYQAVRAYILRSSDEAGHQAA